MSTSALRARKISGITPLIAQNPEGCGEPLDSCVEEYLATLRMAARSPHTIRSYRGALEGVGLALAVQLHGDGAGLGDVAVCELTRRTVRRAFLVYADGRCASSLALAHGVWTRFGRFLIDDGLLSEDAMAGVPKPRAARRAPRALHPTPAGESPVGALLAAAGQVDERAKLTRRWPQRDLALIALFCSTGVRLAEGVGLSLQDLRGAAGERTLLVHGKGSRDRVLPVCAELEALIEAYLASRVARHGPGALSEPAAPLFVSYDGSPLTAGRVEYLVGRLYERAAVKPPAGALVHALRHTFATDAIAGGADIVCVRDLLGHASAATTSAYLESTGARLRSAVASHPARGALAAACGRAGA